MVGQKVSLFVVIQKALISYEMARVPQQGSTAAAEWATCDGGSGGGRVWVCCFLFVDQATERLGHSGAEIWTLLTLL